MSQQPASPPSIPMESQRSFQQKAKSVQETGNWFLSLFPKSLRVTAVVFAVSGGLCLSVGYLSKVPNPQFQFVTAILFLASGGTLLYPGLLALLRPLLKPFLPAAKPICPLQKHRLILFRLELAELGDFENTECGSISTASRVNQSELRQLFADLDGCHGRRS